MRRTVGIGHGRSVCLYHAGAECHHSAPVSFDAVTCRLSILKNAIADAPAIELSRRLARPSSGLVRALARASRLVKGAAAAVDHGRLKRAENRLIALQQALGQFARRVDKARARDLLSAGFQDTLDRTAQDTMVEARTLP